MHMGDRRDVFPMAEHIQKPYVSFILLNSDRLYSIIARSEVETVLEFCYSQGDTCYLFFCMADLNRSGYWKGLATTACDL